MELWDDDGTQVVSCLRCTAYKYIQPRFAYVSALFGEMIGRKPGIQREPNPPTALKHSITTLHPG